VWGTGAAAWRLTPGLENTTLKERRRMCPRATGAEEKLTLSAQKRAWNPAFLSVHQSGLLQVEISKPGARRIAQVIIIGGGETAGAGTGKVDFDVGDTSSQRRRTGEVQLQQRSHLAGGCEGVSARGSPRLA